MSEVHKHSNLELEYAQINNNFRFLAEVRFKLLALVPTLGGAAVFVLSNIGLKAGVSSAGSFDELLLVLFVGTVGFLALLGITLYDLRNSELYNALIHRAKHLETQLNLQGSPGGLKISTLGGQFNERPHQGRRFILRAGHDLSLALIYGPLLGAWLFPVLYSALRLGGGGIQIAQLIAAAIAAIASATFVCWLVLLDRRELELYHAAAKRDGL